MSKIEIPTGTTWSKKSWPDWLPWIGWRREKLRWEDAIDFGLDGIRGQRWAEYETLTASWFGYGILISARGPYPLPVNLAVGPDGEPLP